MTKVSPIDAFMTVIADFTSSDASVPEYVSTKTDYAYGDTVKIAALRMKYKLATTTVDAGVVPSENSDIWIKSPLNEYAAFYYDSTAPTTSTTGIKWIIDTAYTDTVFLQDISGTDAIVTLKDAAGTTLYTETRQIETLMIITFGDYLFPSPAETIIKPQFDMFHPLASTIEIEITGDASCRFVVPGKKERLGYTLSDGVGYAIDDFYKSERDPWGDIVWGESRVIETASLPAIQHNDVLNNGVNALKALQGQPMLMLGDDRDYKDRQFPFINLFGKITSARVSPLPSVSEIVIEMEGI